jgi:hypothetical protein
MRCLFAVPILGMVLCVAACGSASSATLGAPLSAFIAKYGPSQAADPRINLFPINANRNADLIVTVTSGKVTDLVLSAFTATWDDAQTVTACVPFLPVGAAQFNAVGPYIDYHSSLGDVIMQHTAGSCHLSFSST